ncbi:acylneuraminate cytidylyltransferase family protein [Amylibacter sp.]|nr:acylneuraminate cytidylyltransferase family protein [Amylibacter sp.]MDC1413554.1 acylneuraminate cytidylyltransferase family protein [Amylibacter sp.]
MNKLLAVIPARGGSKGLPHKNILDVAGKPLIAWTIEAALRSECISRVIVTTDDPEISTISALYGAEVPFLRPKNLSTDTAETVDVLAHAIRMVPGYSDAVLLQPTSPLRTSEDLDRAYELWKKTTAYSCVSVRASLDNPWLMYTEQDGRITKLLENPENGLRRQEVPKSFTLNGAFYFVNSDFFMQNKILVSNDTVMFEMPTDRSIDIDTLSDLKITNSFLDGSAK